MNIEKHPLFKHHPIGREGGRHRRIIATLAQRGYCVRPGRLKSGGGLIARVIFKSA